MKKPVQFGKYLLLDRINVGGMAEVFKAKAFGVEGFERLVAVKRILPNIAEDEEFITMFIDEAKIAVQLNHANVCQIFDLGKVDDSFFIALEFVQGKDLRGMFDLCKAKPGINEGSPAMPIAQSCFIIMKACEGLDYAHNKKDGSGQELHLVHRDVSPQNILISYEGEVKLIDFGIAKAAGKVSKTQQGILKGKFGYMSPEQVRGLPLDRRSDIFSLGICLYEMLTAERLFVGESDFSTLEKVRNVEILPPSTYNRRIPEELERICLKALAKDVEDRYQNAIDLHDDLQAFMYTAGEFYARKDLGGWMKRVYDDEIRAEQGRLESYQHLPAVNTPPPAPAPRRSQQMQAISSAPPPVPMAARTGGHAAVNTTEPPTNEVPRVDPAAPIVPITGGPPAITGPHAAPNGKHANGHANGAHKADLAWDDEEQATNIYDDKAVAADDSVVSDRPLRPDLSKVELALDGAPVPAPARPATPARGVPSRGGLEPIATRLTGKALAVSQPHSITEMNIAVGQRPRSRGPSSGMIAGLVLVAIVAIGGGAVWLSSMGNRPGQLQITSEPPGAQILIDNVRVAEATPATIDEKPGSYAITVQREGYVPYSEQVDVRTRELLRRHVVLDPLTSGTGFKLSEPIGAQVFLDGKQLEGQTPLQVQSVMPGKHKVEVRGPYGAWNEEITLEAGKMADLHPIFPTSPSALAPVPQHHAAAPEPRVEPVQHRIPAPRDDADLEPPVRHTVAPKKVAAPTPSANADDEEDPVTPAARPAAAKPDRTPDRGEDKAPASGGEGYLRINSKPWTNINIDGKETGMHTPQTQIKLSAGAHRVTLSNPQFGIKETFNVEIHTGATETVVKSWRPKDEQPSDDD